MRNNFIHGQKRKVSKDTYQRDKDLVSMAAQVTDIILENLEEAEVFQSKSAK